ncbi:smoothened homolog isoform X2 [Paramacrobiotus metropolitanus]|uniref:smoothened homolog isoform X2 n=1 Tax=Paramacrobiotus metropolitanus TaxID=2943436 RepID=UPI002445E8F7|nr:smoothened homolog isoform X2 [Paramacrobiotus metropolitanus]
MCRTMAATLFSFLVVGLFVNNLLNFSVIAQTRTQCAAVEDGSCLNVTLPYTSRVAGTGATGVPLPLTDSVVNSLRYLPECWRLFQPIYCGLTTPKCHASRRYYLLRHVCQQMRAACAPFVDRLPNFFGNCSDPYLYAQDNNTLDMEYTLEMTSLQNFSIGICPDSLVRTDDAHRFYTDINECGIRCEDPFLSYNEQNSFRMVMLFFVMLCLTLNTFGMVSLILKLRVAKAIGFNPDTCALMMNISFVLSSLGYLLQFFPGIRNITTCSNDGLRLVLDRYADGTDRVGLCLLTFFLTYVFTLSSFVWFGHLMFACYLDFQKIINSYRKSKAVLFTLSQSSWVFFHGTGFVLPIIVAIAVVFLHAVEGNSMLGVCWISPLKHKIKALFVLAPFAVVLIVACVFIVLYWLNLRQSQLSQFGTLKTQRNVLRRLRLVGSLCVLITAFHVFQFGGFWGVVHNEPFWRAKQKEYIECQLWPANLTDPKQCLSIVESVKNSYLAVYYCLILSYFANGITISTWTWNIANINRWKKMLTGKEIPEEPYSDYRTRSESQRSQKDSLISKPKLFDRPRSQSKKSNPDHDVGSPALIVDDHEVPMHTPSDPVQNVPFEMTPLAQRFRRTSIVPGRKISSVADFTQITRLQNWQEEAKRARLNRTRSKGSGRDVSFTIAEV